MGKSSRDKGARGEYMVRDYMRNYGYEAYRVPASGAAQGFPGDVLAIRGSSRLLIESKFRRNAFKAIYSLLDSGTKDIVVDDLLLARVSYDLSVLDNNSAIVYRPVAPRLSAKLVRMYAWLKGADLLVVKDNNRPLIFIRFIRG